MCSVRGSIKNRKLIDEAWLGRASVIQLPNKVTANFYNSGEIRIAIMQFRPDLLFQY